MLEITGCDGVMIGRGGLGNPWIFKSVESVLDGKEPLPEPSLEDKRQALLQHLELELKYRDERMVICHMRRIACWYFKNSPGVNEFRGTINTTKTVAGIRKLIEDFGLMRPSLPL